MRHVKHKVMVVIGMVLFLFCLPSTLPAQESTTAGIQLAETIICRSIENRMPIGSGSVFSVGAERLFCFTKVIGATDETTVIHHWYLNGKLKSSVTLPVKSASWRTWSSKEIAPNETGDWMVEVMTADGQALESIIFFVQ